MQLTTDQLRIVQAAYDVFRVNGQWPVVDAIDRVADERWELDAYPVLRSLPPRITLVDRLHLGEDQPVRVRVRGIMACEGADEDLALFVRAVRWLAEKERGFRATSMHAPAQVRVTSEQFRADLASEGIAIDRVASAKVRELVDVERLNWGGSYGTGDDSGRWEINLRRDVRPFRRVETLSDYVAIRDRLDDEAESEAKQTPGMAQLLGLAQPHSASAPIDPRHFVFIAMPFKTPWADAVNARIRETCHQVDSDGLALRWQRADEIQRPGRITEQILDALQAADVVIADITGLNANVIYEVGYADASGTPLIVLNQRSRRFTVRLEGHQTDRVFA